MKPVLFTIGSFNVYAFGFFLFLALVLSTFILYQLSKLEFKEEEYFDAYLYTSIAAVIAARIGFIIMHINAFGINILRYILVRETPGLSILAGSVGGFLFLLWYARHRKLPLGHLLDIFSVVSSCALFLTKIAQQLAGGGFGKETNFFLGVNIVGRTGRYHPVEFYEASVYLALFIMLYILYKIVAREKWPVGLVSCVYGIGVALTVFLLEFFKIYTVYLYGLSFRQLIAIVGFIILMKPTIVRILQIIRMGKKHT